MEPVEEWSKKQRPLLKKIRGIELRDSNFNDDRLNRALETKEKALSLTGRMVGSNQSTY